MIPPASRGSDSLSAALLSSTDPLDLVGSLIQEKTGQTFPEQAKQLLARLFSPTQIKSCTIEKNSDWHQLNLETGIVASNGLLGSVTLSNKFSWKVASGTFSKDSSDSCNVMHIKPEAAQGKIGIGFLSLSFDIDRLEFDDRDLAIVVRLGKTKEFTARDTWENWQSWLDKIPLKTADPT